jgi:threonine synthase
MKSLTAAAYAGFRRAAVAPLTQVDDNLFALELFHGPTLAFKDFAMQWLGRAMNRVLRQRGARATIIGATSGDTGAAAIEAFAEQSQVEVFILYPHGRVSDVQRRQMTTVNRANVHALAIQGSFDDCQRIVKELFGDLALRDEMRLSGVNSINWARIAAQVVYYFTAAVVLGAPHRKVAFTVPTGNFGDIYAGYVALRMGLPIDRLVIATNVNDILARTLATGAYELREVIPTASPSMDIQVASNFERALFEAAHRDADWTAAAMNDFTRTRRLELPPPVLAELRSRYSAFASDDDETRAAIKAVYRLTGRIIDPHTAVGVAAAMKMGSKNQGPLSPVVILSTAHPAKFPQAVTEAIGAPPPEPERLAGLKNLPERQDVLDKDAVLIKRFISSKLAA